MNEAPAVIDNQTTNVPVVEPIVPVVEPPVAVSKPTIKIKVATQNLAAAVQAVKPFINSKTSLPILSNIRLAQSAGKLTISATNLDCTIVTVIDSISRSQGSTTLPVRQLADILKGCDCDVQMECDKHDKISIVSGGTSSTVLGLAAEEYPADPECLADRSEVISQATLKQMFRRVSRCMSTDETRYVLNGILLQREKGQLRVVATDGRRLALSEFETDITDQDFAVIIPRETVNKVDRLLSWDATGNVTITAEYDHESFAKHVKEEAEAAAKAGREVKVLKLKDENMTRIRFAFDTPIGKGAKRVMLPVVITSKTVEGTYPNYRQVIPVDHLERIEIPRKELADRVAQVATNVRCDNQPSVKLTFTKKLLTVLTRNKDGGESQSAIALSHIPKKDRVICFNPGYFIDALMSVPEYETILLEMTDELSPGTFKVNGENWLLVLMPMRLN